MSEKYKLGLTRNRLFEFDNAVVFCGKSDFQKDGLDKALKLLCIKEPLLTAQIHLESDGTAYAVTETVEQSVNRVSLTKDELVAEYEREGVDFSSRVFEFSVSDDGFLVIAGHTALADAKALLRLAGELNLLYNEPLSNIEPSKINLISEKTNLPLEVASPIIDRLSAELDMKWQKDSKIFGLNDYKEAKKAYDIKRTLSCGLFYVFNKEDMNKIRGYCKDKMIDTVSFVGCAFYDALVNNIPVKKKSQKMNIYADERLFFMNHKDYGVGAFNGVVSASYKKKLSDADFDEKVKSFHLDCYKSTTSTFKVFYDDVLLMRVEPSLCDSTYMYKSGVFKSKASKRVAENYGCACEKLCDYLYCNLDQTFWGNLNGFSDITVNEPFKMRSATTLSFVIHKGVGRVSFRYRADKCESSLAQKIFDEAISIVKNTAKI